MRIKTFLPSIILHAPQWGRKSTLGLSSHTPLTIMAPPDLNQRSETCKGILASGSTAESQLGFLVVNLSKIHLSNAQVQALEKGLTFCPVTDPKTKQGEGIK